MSKKTLPEAEIESPIPFRTGSNGEYVPREATAADRRAEELFREAVDERARGLGISRRQFVESAAGTATALMVINTAYGCGGSDGGAADGGYAVDSNMTWDAGACEPLAGSEFIFDVQTHHINPDGGWRTTNPNYALFFQSLPQASCGEADALDCFNVENYTREMFVNSDTAVAVLSAVPADPGENPLDADEQRVSRDLINALASSQRLVTHGLVLPDLGQAQLDGMQALAETLQIGAWKIYTPYGAGGGGGWRLDDPAIGIPFIEKARELNIKTICCHKGLPLFGFDPLFSAPDDIGVVAAMFPDVKFVVYHSAYETSITEGPYNAAAPEGIDRLIKTLEDAGIGPTGNVYAELGSTWRNVMTSPTEAQHVIGKLLKHLGPDRILWGTDSIWYGTPQDQIVAFRALEISQAMQDMHGYPALTQESREKIFGLNAAAIYGVDPAALRCKLDEDDLSSLKRAARAGELPSPKFRNYGPRTRREFFNFLNSRAGRPG